MITESQPRGHRPPEARALLADGSCVLIRSAVPADWQAVHDFVDALGRESIYRRFFGYPARPGKMVADSVCTPEPAAGPAPRGGLLALLDGELVGIAEWIRGQDPREAEIAFTVADRMHGHGVGTLLAEHLLDAAEHAGVHRFTAITQAENYPMLDVFAALGLPVTRSLDHGTWSLTIDLDLDAAARVALLDTVARRERTADEVSLRHLFNPAGLLICGDPADPATAAALRNAAGYGRPVWSAGADASDLPVGAAAPLAVVTSPPPLAARAVRECARHGAQAVIVTATRFGTEDGRALLGVCREYGVRLLGPGSLGVAVPRTRLAAGLVPPDLTAGPVGVVTQSGGVGLALLARLAGLGLGVRSFAAVGEKYDVSANDALMHWESDPATRLGLIHLESFGNPRKFARTARRLSRTTPLLAVDPDAAVQPARAALYRQAGVVAVRSLGALVDAAALLATGPAPRGDRVAVLGNTHGMVTLAVRACAAAGLHVMHAQDLTAATDDTALSAALDVAIASGDCDCVLVTLAPTVPRAPDAALRGGTLADGVRVVAVLADQEASVRLAWSNAGSGDGAEASQNPDAPVGTADAGDADADAAEGAVACYPDAVQAAAALAAAVTAGRLRERAPDTPPFLSGVDSERARGIIDSCLATYPRGHALYSAEAAELLDAYGVRLAAYQKRDSTERSVRFTVTAWQDSIFGPLLSCAPEGRPADGETLLAPAGRDDLAALARQVLAAAPADADQDGLTELLARCARMVDELPRLSALDLTVELAAPGGTRAVAVEATAAPLERTDPYLRRLRRAPVE